MAAFALFHDTPAILIFPLSIPAVSDTSLTLPALDFPVDALTAINSDGSHGDHDTIDIAPLAEYRVKVSCGMWGY